jgi:hypothetical protein
MRATAEDLPAAGQPGLAPGGKVSAAGMRGPARDTPAPASAAGLATPGGDYARSWLARRLDLPGDVQPMVAHVGFLALTRAVEALERAQDSAITTDPTVPSLYIAVAEQYRQIADVCGQRGGSAVAPPRPPAETRTR